ncbi:hypothetical protein [Nitrospirillum iridis]|uniref:YfhO family protein n=1 Tax=Nitrospirillum iridis TaxID=765888 RepID=A0A7X0AVU8_9PROT|nr:hypothetical protein [Nitrospirillum iridis]MBB6249624.1 hypothetical protein [Nitrospirillum iridis]
MMLNTAAAHSISQEYSASPPSHFKRPPTEAALRAYKWAIILVLLAPLLVKLPLILGLLLADPRILYSGLAADVVAPRGLSTLDPNIAFTSDALGHRAALDLLSGHIPWWNPYEGVGGPMAGEMQSAALFPLNLLLALPNGQLYMHLSLQLLSGLFTVLLMRRLGTSALAASAAGLLFEFNGTFAWLANAVVNPIPFLPMVLLGVEEVRHRVLTGLRGGWAWIGIGLALSLYSGFPEVAYLNGLLIGAWTLARLPLAAKRPAVAYLLRVGLGAAGGLALAAPILIAFLGYLPDAFVGGHEGNGFRDAHVEAQHLVNLTIPYLFGRLAELPGTEGGMFWGGVGGYVPFGGMALAIAGCFGRTLRGLRWTLAAWSAVALAAIYGTPVLTQLVTSIPAVGTAAFFRYLPPSVEFAMAVLAGFACQDLIAAGLATPHRRLSPALLMGLVLASTVTALGMFIAVRYYPQLPRPSIWFPVSLGLVALAATLIFLLNVARLSSEQRALAASGIVAVEAVLMFAFPMAVTPRKGTLVEGGVQFLQSNLHLQRFYTLGPIAPNYGAYYGIASINHNDLPLPRAWVRYVPEHLDSNIIDILFTGNQRAVANGPSAADELRRNLEEYQRVGVRYLVMSAGENPFRRLPREFAVERPNNQAISLSDGGKAVLRWSHPDIDQPVAAVSIMIGTYNNKSDGLLAATICADDICADTTRDLTKAGDNQFLTLDLAQPLPPPKEHLTISLRKVGGGTPVALWAWPSQPDSRMSLAVDGFSGPAHEVKIAVDLSDRAEKPKQVYADRVMTIFELPNPAPYFAAEGCELQPQSREWVVADCAAAASLTRQELFLPGWSAQVGADQQEVRPDGPIFQKIDLPAGRSEVRFRYRPPYMPAGYALFLVGIALALWALRSGAQADRKQA